MEMGQEEKKLADAWVPVTTAETSLISNLIYEAIKNLTLDNEQKKTARHFIAKLQRAALSSKQPVHSH